MSIFLNPHMENMTSGFSSSYKSWKKWGILGAGVLLGNLITQTAEASDDILHPPHYPWNHRFPWQSFDHASIRRGHQVYKTVCSSCHSLDRIAYRNLIDVAYTEEDAKKMAAEVDIQDGPNSEGDMFERPGRLSDYMPRPYQNEQAARYANNGSYPPDLSVMIKARGDHENYLFSLLTGYRDPPHGVEMRKGQYYNPYFPGGAIAMPQALSDGKVEYDDGTPATISQMAKDVSTFLCWTAEPEHDERKLMGFKALFVVTMMLIPTFYWRRMKWSSLKSRVIAFRK